MDSPVWSSLCLDKTRRTRLKSTRLVRNNLVPFTCVKRIGEGTFGTVYSARDRRCKQRVTAVKQYLKRKYEDGIPYDFILETGLLSQCEHSNIVKMYELFCVQENWYMVMEGMKCNLRQYYKTKCLTCIQTRSIMKQFMFGLSYLHDLNIMHRDLKPHNILVNETVDHCVIKIADFGISRVWSTGRTFTTDTCTLWYRAPEMLLGMQKYNKSVDMWAAGCVYIELCMNTPYFTGNNQWETMISIFSILGTPSTRDWPDVCELPEFSYNFPKFTA